MMRCLLPMSLRASVPQPVLANCPGRAKQSPLKWGSSFDGIRPFTPVESRGQAGDCFAASAAARNDIQ